MKRIISLILFISTLIALLSACKPEQPRPPVKETDTAESADTSISTETALPPAPSGPAPYTWELNSYKSSGGYYCIGADTHFEFNSLKLVRTESEASITFEPDSYELTFCEDGYRYVALSIMAAPECESISCLIYSSPPRGERASDELTFRFTESGEWSRIIIDTKSLNAWQKHLLSMTLTLIDGTDAEFLRIERLGLFANEDEAKIFLEDTLPLNVSSSTDIYKGNIHIFVAKGTLSGGYRDSELLISRENTAEASGSIIPIPAFMKDGIAVPIPVSYVNSSGAITYMAEQVGEYVLICPESNASTDAEFLIFRKVISSDDVSCEKITRHTLFLSLYNCLTKKPQDTSVGFSDAPVGCEALYSWVRSARLTVGETARPNEYASLSDVATAVSAFLKYVGSEPYTDSDLYNGGTDDALLRCRGMGIINDNEKSDAATVSGDELSTVLVRMIKAILGHPLHESKVSSGGIRFGAHFDNRGYVSEGDIRLFSEAGLELLLANSQLNGTQSIRDALCFGDKYGVGLLFTDDFPAYTLNTTSVPAYTHAFADFTSFIGGYSFKQTGGNYLKVSGMGSELYSTSLSGPRLYSSIAPIYSNGITKSYNTRNDTELYRSSSTQELTRERIDAYKKYVSDYVSSVSSDHIWLDYYPFAYEKAQPSNLLGYLLNYEIAMNACRESGRELWAGIQSGLRNVNDSLSFFESEPITDAELRFQLYTALSFGARTFIYNSYNNSRNHDMLEDGKKTDLYASVQIINAEIKALEDELCSYKHLGAFVHSTSLTNRKYLEMEDPYKDFSAIKDLKSSEAILIGCFEGDDGFAFTAVNMSNPEMKKGASFSFSADAGYRVFLWQKGQKTELTQVNGTCTVSLECGEGVFVTLEK